MTCIVNPEQFPSKLSLRRAIAAREPIEIEDPSVFKPRKFLVADMTPGQVEVVTNHPKRSWFAELTKLADGRVQVK